MGKLKLTFGIGRNITANNWFIAKDLIDDSVICIFRVLFAILMFS